LTPGRPLTRTALVALLLVTIAVSPSLGISAAQGTSWRSSLYPESWTPGYADGAGRFLHDFSYAGYHASERPIPTDPPGIRLDVTQSPYLADSTGAADATAAIQSAIDAVGAAGGGIVHLPAGLYRIAPRGPDPYALRIQRSGVILRGAGPDATRLFLSTSSVRNKQTIRVAPSGSASWTTPLAGTSQALRTDVDRPTTVLPLDGPPRFSPGDWVIIAHDTTEAWNHEHNMDCASYPSPCWNPNQIAPATFYRRVTGVDTTTNSITVDAPTRYFLRTRDNARAYRVAPHIEEVGVEDLAIGEQEHPGECAPGDQGENSAFPCNYETHGHDSVLFRHVVNSWVRNVRSYAPPSNPRGYHLLSDGIVLQRARHVTVEDVDLRKPQNRGGGGNGYPYTHEGNDNLIQRAAGYEGRHNFSFKTALANGNVIRDSYAFKGSLNSDFHRHLSMANLVENVTLDQEIFEADWRRDFGNVHALTGTQNVFWNIQSSAPRGGATYSVISNPFGWGLVVGTRGAAPGVRVAVTAGRTEPEDFVEGEGQGASLAPQSLSRNQLARRLAGPSPPTATPGSTGTPALGTATAPSPTPPATSAAGATSPPATATATATATARPATPSVIVSPTTAPAVGGRGFTLRSLDGQVQLTWSPGTAQTGYVLLRLGGVGTSAVIPVAGTATEATDRPPGFSCYALAALRGATAVALSDVLCVVFGPQLISAPRNMSIQLNQGTTSSLAWTPLTGATGLVLVALGTSRARALPAAATGASDDTRGVPACYVVAAVAGASLIGSSDIVCGIPGLSRGLSAEPSS
jgi:hypothetical protein